MESEIGRYFEGRLLETQKIMKAIYDVGLGCGEDTVCWIDGRELVFGRGEPKQGRGFIRMIPGEISVVLAFPAGRQLFDPKKKLRGPINSQLSLSMGHVAEIDTYLRRLIEDAYFAHG